MKCILPAMMVCAIACGCANMKKNNSASNIPAANVAVSPPAPAATFTPAAQPVITEPVATTEAPAEQLASTDETIAPSAPAHHARAERAVAVPKARTAASITGSKYTIKKGDSLWSIAQSKYGNGNKWKTIAAANPKLDPNKIQAGQTITLP